MRQEAKDYVKRIVDIFDILDPIYEIGSYRVDGQEEFADLRPLFKEKGYIGCDLRPGLGVDKIEDVQNLTLEDEGVGTILTLDTLEHVENPIKAMDEIYRVLKPGGIVIMTSVMNFPIHEYPSDYWRFTPECFYFLLQKFDKYDVEYDGDDEFPVGIYGWGMKAKQKSFSDRVTGYNPKGSDLDNKNYLITKKVEMIGGDKEVLELGCNKGEVSRILKEMGCRTVGIESKKEAAEIAKKYCDRVIVGDIDTLNYKEELGDKQFDVALFNGGLEHLKNPKSALLETRKYLKTTGKIVISTHNIAHCYIRLDVLTGEFECGDVGILDESRLGYFTKKSIVRLLDESGFYIEEICGVTRGLSTETINKFLSKIGLSDNQRVIDTLNQPEALAYQYVAKASLQKPEDYSIDRILNRPIKAINYMDQQLQAKDQQLQGRYQQLKDRYQQLQAKDQQLQAKDQQLQAKDQELQAKDQQLQRIYNLRGWRVLCKIYRIMGKTPFLRKL